MVVVEDPDAVDGVRAQVVVAGLAREGDPADDPDFVPNVVAQLHHHWIDSELARRGLQRDAVYQALVMLPPPGEAVVRVNEEAGFVAVAGEDARIVAPSDVFVGQITSLWPTGVDPDIAWMGYVTARGGRAVAVEMRRNRERVRDLLDRAGQFLESARSNLDGDRVAPAVEDMHAAAELAVMTMMQLEATPDRRRHRTRIEWLEGAVRYSDVPPAFAETLKRLADERNVARYAERALTIERDEASRLLDTVGAMLEYAEERRA